jgi:exodeoxyribonuclease V
MIELSAKQDAFLCQINDWLGEARGGAFSAPWKYLAGVAGSGKTTLAKKLSEDRRVAYCAFTGKAANVLREKGCVGATTLHKLIYRPEEKVARAATGESMYSTEFVARDDNPLADFDVVVLDECSMVDARMAQDLLSYGVPVLVLGDPFQLPPVSGEGYFTKREPTWFLDEVHRQALDSGILRLATDIRTGRGIGDPASYGPDAVVISLEEATEHEDELLQWRDVVLVGTHRMREHFNKRFREVLKFNSAYPEAGDELVCLQNDHKRGLLNGATWRCELNAREVGHLKLEVLVRSADDPKQVLLADVWAHDFLGIEGELQKLPWQRRSERARFTYGYALTVHKSQGSEWAKVLVVDESTTFREHAMNWLYTAVTRASKKLVLVRR